ncbi:sensor histidine kinase [Sphingobium agri]|uniref:Histidine kinase n=1 Tax=Sphingobium agri TaxID=2933566 RepID=A0ABT0DVK6_9SPHN|nr:histidine kinase [Sphingobium agri]MCK0531143.1 histidine kinase [Sphingobium agri]
MTNGHAEMLRAFRRRPRAGLSALRPWRMLDVTRLVLALVYTVVSFAFASPRSWAEIAENGIIFAMLLLALGALILSARSWVTEMRIRKPVVFLDALLFLSLLVVTNASDSPYFFGSLFVAIEIALIVRSRFHLLVGAFAAMTALLTVWMDKIVEVPSEPDPERVALRVLYLAVVIVVTGMLLGPRREKLLQEEKARRLTEGSLPLVKGGSEPFLLQALKIATGSENGAVLFRTASTEAYRFASSRFGETRPEGSNGLLAVETGWHDCRRGASIGLSQDGISHLAPLSPGGRAWAAMLDAETLMTLRVSLGTFDAVGAVELDDPTHEDAAAIAQRVFESACDEMMVRNSLDLAHVIAGARERERLQRELHDSVLQALASIRYQVAPVLNGTIDNPLPVLANVDRIAKDQIGTIRWIINPVEDDEDFAYLPETLSMVVRSLAEQWGIRCELRVEDGNCATSAMIGRELSFAVREIVANAVRHAGAHAVEFSLQPAGNRIALHVTDDGVPNLARLGSTGAVQSRSLMRRVQALGGEVYLRNIGGRTMIQITVPRK